MPRSSVRWWIAIDTGRLARYLLYLTGRREPVEDLG